MTLRVVVFPESWRVNPMLDLIEHALKDQGVEFRAVGSDYVAIGWLLRQRSTIDVLHFHWLQYHYLRSSALASWVAFSKFSAKLVLARLLGYRIVWTMHNVLPHERPYAVIDYLAALFVAQLANSVIVHCQEGHRQLWRVFRRRRKVFMGYLGHYIGAYPDGISRMDARVRLGIASDQVVFLFLGNVRPYKGLEKLMNEFKALNSQRALLLIVGRANDSRYEARIREIAQHDGRVRLVLEWIDGENVQLYFNAADVLVLPYTNILTTSSVPTAFSFGKPVIAPAMGCIPEIATPEIAVLYDPVEPKALGEALQLCLDLDLEAMGRKAREWVKRFSWEELATRTVPAYHV